MAERHTGRCLCGEIIFEFTEPPLWVAHCHCASCRKNTGSAVATFVGVNIDAFVELSGSRSFFQSSPGVRRSYCAQCGTPIAYEAEKYSNEIHLYIGSLDDPNRFRPQFHVHCAERIPWFDIQDHTPRYPGSSDETDHSHIDR